MPNNPTETRRFNQYHLLWGVLLLAGALWWADVWAHLIDNNRDRDWATRLGVALGLGGPCYVGAGIVAAVVWVITKKSTAAMWTWTVVLLSLMVMLSIGASQLRRTPTSASALPAEPEQTTQGNSVLQDERFREGFLRSFRHSCENKQRQSPENKAFGVSEQQIGEYCDCTANHVAGSMTASELIELFKTKVQPPSLETKILEAAAVCASKAIGLQ